MDGWDLSQTTTTIRAPLAVLKRKKDSFGIQNLAWILDTTWSNFKCMFSKNKDLIGAIGDGH